MQLEEVIAAIAKLEVEREAIYEDGQVTAHDDVAA